MSRKEYKRSRNEYDMNESFRELKTKRSNDGYLNPTIASETGLDGKIPATLLKPACENKVYTKQYSQYSSSVFVKYKNRGKVADSKYIDTTSNANSHVIQSYEYSLSPTAQPKDPYPNGFCDHKCLEDKVARGSGLVGLKNLGNTCFMNATLQCLLHCNAIATYFAHRRNESKGSLANSFTRLCREIYHQDNDGIDVDPSEMKEAIGQRAVQFAGYEQQDAHELLRFLLDGLGEDLKVHREEKMEPKAQIEEQLESASAVEQGHYWWTRHLAKNSSFITDEFCGQFRSTVTCLVCGREKYCFDPFYDLSLPLPNESLGCSLRRNIHRHIRSADGCTLSDCLHSLVNDEEVSSDCSWCKKRQSCKRSLRVERAPKILVLHLKRFNNSRRKKNTLVSFPLLAPLEFSRFISSGNTGSKSLLYDLFAICHHTGRTNSGHYVATCLDKVSGKFFRYDDSSVSEISSDDLSLCQSPYMLFYKLR